MSWCRILLVLALALVATTPASAQLFGKRPAPKGPPAQRVPELLVALKSDIDERKRIAAAEELQHFDLKEFPAIVPSLVEALERDPKTGVRLEVVHALGKLRPVSQPAGLALEKAAAHDASIRVRLQARTALMWYYMAGYTAKGGDQPPTVKTTEPPLADPNSKYIPPGNQKHGAIPSVSDYRPLPLGPMQQPQLTPPPLVSPNGPALTPPPPLPVPMSEGPALIPQK